MDWLSLLLFLYDHRQQQWMYLKAHFKESFMHQRHVFIHEWTSFIGENLNAKERKQMSVANHYAVAIVKRIAGCIENQSS